MTSFDIELITLYDMKATVENALDAVGVIHHRSGGVVLSGQLLVRCVFGLVQTIVGDAGNLGKDLGGVNVARDVDGSTEAVDKPVDGHNDGVHARDGNVDRVGNHDGEDQRRRRDGRGADGSQCSQQGNNDVLHRAQLDALGLGQEDDADGEVDGGSVSCINSSQ